MARTVPVHTGYTILNGTGTGPNGNRIDVWVEYGLGSQNVTGNYTPVTAYFYTALNPSYTSSTAYSSGLNAQFTVNGIAGTAVADGAYDFSSPGKINLLGSYSGNIAHDKDGKGKLSFAGSFTTLSSYISGGSIRAEASLPTIVTAAEVSADDVTLGERCALRWTPASREHSFVAEFTLGSWSLTTPRIYPKTTGSYTYNGTLLPLGVAAQFKTAAAQMQVKLTTYSGTAALGSHTTGFFVTVPQTAATCPAVSAGLYPVCDAFPGLYVQRLGKVRAEATATDPYGADITGWQIAVDAQAVSGKLSGFLQKTGTLPVRVTATSSRGFTGAWVGEITVLPYDSPRLTGTAFRCLSDGTPDPGGTCLGLEFTQAVSMLEDGNQATLCWRYKPSGGDYSPWADCLTEDGIVPGVVLEKDQAYTVQLKLTDTGGGKAELTLAIPMEQVYLHRTPNAMGLGGYVQGEQVLDVHWDIRARKGLNGAYVCSLTPAEKTFSAALSGLGQQALFLLSGSAQGVITLNGSVATWSGTAGVTVTGDSGRITVTLPGKGPVLLLSPNPIEI